MLVVLKKIVGRAVLIAFAVIAVILVIGPVSQSNGAARAPMPAVAPGQEQATFGGGCFWCMQEPFLKLDGVVSVTAGFMGGTTENPTYWEVAAGGTGHIEVVHVVFDPKKVSYKKLLEVYQRNVDPYDNGGQFCDRGHTYIPVIFAHTPEQRKEAEAALATLAKSGPLKEPVVVSVVDASTFTPAEELHQKYHEKNPFRYKLYRQGCGRDARLEELWGKPATH